MNRHLLRTGSSLLAAMLVVGLLPMTVLAAAPAAVPDAVSTNEDTTKVITLVGTDDDGDGLTFSIASGPTHGTLGPIGPEDCTGSPSTCTADVTYTPDADFHGADDFTFEANDGVDADQATIDVTVVSQNDDPDAVNDPTNPIVEDTTTTLDVLANDDDVDGDALTIISKTNGTKGTVVINAGADVSYNPSTNATGTDSFTYTISDGHGGTDSATVTVQIASENDDPVANPDSNRPVVEDVAATIDVLANDTDPDSATLTIIATTDGTKGSVSITNGGDDLSYDPDANVTGSDTFTYTVSDGSGGTDVGTVTVLIASVNDAPSGTNGSISVLEGATYTFDVSDFGFSDPDDSPPNALNTVRFATVPALGVIRLNGSAIDAGDSVSAASLNANLVTYTPAADASGNGYASFTFQVSDTGGVSDGGINLDPTPNTITVNVTGINSAPSGTNHTVTMTEDTVHTFVASEFGFSDANDSPADSLAAVRITTLPTSGVLRNNGATFAAGTSITVADIAANRLRFTPAADGNGAPYASFTFQVRDDGGTANGGVDLDPSANVMTINVTPQNDGPTAVDDTQTIAEDSGPATIIVVGNDIDIDGPPLAVTAKTDPDHGALTLVSGILTYTPDADFNGTDEFDYTVSDGTLDDEGHVTITVTPVNDPPVAFDDTANMTEDPGPRVISVLGNDDDIDGDTITVTTKTEPAHGTLTLVAGVLTYTPAANYFGADGFTYTISDGEFTDIGAVAITVTSENDPPVADDDSVTVTRDTAANPVGVLTNDSDVELDPLQITGKTNGAKGTVVITGGGTGLTYDPFTGYLGADSFTYTISDGNGGTDTATVTVNITGDNRAPNAVNDVGFSVPEGAAATVLDVLANDDDPDGDTFTVVARTNGARGITRVTAGGDAVTYDPNTGFYGTDSFTYTIQDAGGKIDTATVVVTVTRDRTAPVVVAPAQRFLGQTVGTSTIKVRMTWSGTDPGSGIKSYQLQESRNGGTYTNVTLITPTRIYADRVLTNNASYRYRVRATDREGNVSGWRYSQTFKPAVFQESSGLASYTGAWLTYKTTGALGGAVKYTPTLGKKVAFTYTVYDLALVMTRTASSGSADIYVDGVLSTRINLRATKTTYRQLVYTKHFTTLGAHTIEIRPIGTGRVDIDGFAVLR